LYCQYICYNFAAYAQKLVKNNAISGLIFVKDRLFMHIFIGFDNNSVLDALI